MVACGAPLDTALQSLRLQADLDLHRAVGAVRPHPLPVLERSSTSSSFRLSCTDASVASHLRISLCALSAPRWFFVAVEALVVPLRPARVLVLLGILGGLLLPKRTWNPGRCHHSRFYEYTPFCNGPVDVNCSPIVTPPSSRFCPWSTLRPPHYAVRGSGEPI